MMLQDQLSRAQRIRLESLSQAMTATSMTSDKRPTLDKIFENARAIEKFLKEARDDA